MNEMTPTPPERTVPSSPGEVDAGGDASVVDQAQQKVGKVRDQAQETAGKVTEQAKLQAASQLESRKDRAIDSLVVLAQALRQTGQHLHEQEQGTIAGYVDRSAERVEELTNHLRRRDVSQLLADTEDLARRSPGVFLGAAAAIGFVGARFLMSSGRRARAQTTTNAYRGVSGASSAYGGTSAYGKGSSLVPGRSAGVGFDAATPPHSGEADSALGAVR
jgi:hypothetical protein